MPRHVRGEATNTSAVAETFPSKPVRVIEPFGAGGGPDRLARSLADELSKLWSRSVTVENVPGQGATAGPAKVAQSPPDGFASDIAQVLAGRNLRDWIARHGGEPMSMTRAEFARFVLSESESAAQIKDAANKP